LNNLRSENPIPTAGSSHEIETKEAHVMLLGPSDSGKTTFLTQLKIFYGGGFTEQEIEETKQFIYKRFFADIVELIQGCQGPHSDEYREKHKEIYQFAKEYVFGRSFSPELRDSVQRLVEDDYTEIFLDTLKMTVLSESTQ
jgi:energy-coupling factor transporter ATP-binding protein EcfA2